MTLPRLVVIVDHEYLGSDTPRWLRLVENLGRVAPAVLALQLRAKQLTSEARIALFRGAVRQLSGSEHAPLIANGHRGEARLAGCDGVHWPEAWIPQAGEASAQDRLPCSASVHGTQALARAHRAGARFVHFGPVFPPGCKNADAVGLGPLRDLVARSPIPVLAVGGIDASRVRACLAAGASGVAVLSTVLGADDPVAAATSLLQQLPI